MDQDWPPGVEPKPPEKPAPDTTGAAPKPPDTTAPVPLPRARPKQDPYIPSERNAPISDVGKPDLVLQGARKDPGGPRGPYLPQAHEIRPVMMHAVGNLSRIGSNPIVQIALGLAALDPAYWQARQRGEEHKAKMYAAQFQLYSKELVFRQTQENRNLAGAIALYGPHDGKPQNDEKLREEIRRIATEAGDDNLLRVLDHGDMPGIVRLIQARHADSLDYMKSLKAASMIWDVKRKQQAYEEAKRKAEAAEKNRRDWGVGGGGDSSAEPPATTETSDTDDTETSDTEKPDADTEKPDADTETPDTEKTANGGSKETPDTATEQAAAAAPFGEAKVPAAAPVAPPSRVATPDATTASPAAAPSGAAPAAAPAAPPSRVAPEETPDTTTGQAAAAAPSGAAPAAAPAAPPSRVAPEPSYTVPVAHPRVNEAARRMQMGEKVDLPKDDAVRGAVGAQKAALDDYMHNLINDKKLSPDEVMARTRAANPAMGDLVQNLMDGTTQLTPTASRKDALAAGLARRINPDWERTAQIKRDQREAEDRRAQLAPIRGALLQQEKLRANLRGVLGKNINDMNYLLHLADKLKEKGLETGSPALDRAIRDFRRTGLGDADVQAFDAQLRLVQTDVGRIMSSGAAGTGAVYPVSAQKEMHEFLAKGLNVEQLRKTVEVIKQDYSNKLQPITDGINEMHGRMAHITQTQPPAPLSDADTLRQINAEKTVMIQGKFYYYYDGKWHDD